MNPRITYQEMGKELDLTSNAVHRRLKILTDDEKLLKIGTRINPNRLNAVMIILIIRLHSYPRLQQIEEIGAHDTVNQIMVATGNKLVVLAELKRIHHLENLLQHVESFSFVESFKHHIIYDPTKSEGQFNISRNDLSIIQSLQKDARCKIADIAELTGLNQKTIRRRLKHLEENDIISYKYQFYLRSPGILFCVIEYSRSSEASPMANIEFFMTTFSESYFNLIPFPDRKSGFVGFWLSSVEDLSQILEQLDEKEFPRLEPGIVIDSYYFDNWIDDLDSFRS